jgi:hypothetical protein
MGWYYYLEDKIRFPFQANCIAAKVVSPLRKGETVEVHGMAPEDACSADILRDVLFELTFPSAASASSTRSTCLCARSRSFFNSWITPDMCFIGIPG